MCCIAAIRGWPAEAPQSIEDILQSVRGRAAVCVQLGCGDGALSVQLAEAGKLFVHALESDPVKVRTVREALQARGLYGQATVEHWMARFLPYADNLVNVLLAENAAAAPESEIKRVLAPNGVAWIRRGDTWRSLRKSWPKEFDEWTHSRHDADGNMVSHDLAVGVPLGLRWVAGPPQDAGGKKWYYDHVLVSAQGRNFYAYENEITARDAFNGVLLWSQPLKAYSFRETGTEVPSFLALKAKLATRPSKVRPVAIEDRLYVAAEGRLLALDAATGNTVTEFGQITSPREILVAGGTLVLADTNVVRAYSTLSGSILWETALAAERIVAGDGSLFCLSSNVVVSFNLATGQERWRIEDTNAIPATTCTYHQGVLVLEKSSWRDDPEGCGLLAYSGKNGRLLWSKDYRPDQTHWQEARSFFARGRLWLQMAEDRVVGFGPQTGKQKEVYGSQGKHCATPVATERFFIAPECEFTDLASGKRSRARMFKSACRLPFIPANGLLYSFPVQCECYPMLRGYMGLTSVPPPRSARLPRLETGPAYGRSLARHDTVDPAIEWPTYRHDVLRSGGTTAASVSAISKVTWTVLVAQPPQAALAAEGKGNPFVKGLLTPPVVAAGKVVVAVPDEHRLVALDAKDGRLRWRFTAGGRIDTPPTLHEDLCLFGAHDGWVYCLSTADGELVWKFRAAPQEARIMAYGQMESLWPVPGSVLVDQGVGYVAAGRHPMSDGGVYVYALQARTGRVVWEKVLTDLSLTNWYSPMLNARQKVGFDFEPMDLLVKDGDTVAMSRWRFQPDNGKYELQLASTNYQAFGLAVPRGLWGYGIRQTKMVQDKPPAVFGQARLYTGTTNDVALLLAGDTVVSASTNGVLKVGERTLTLDAPPVHDGLAAAYGRLYVSARNGKLVCLE